MQDKKVIAKVLSYGDMHLSSRNYGAHRDYPKESLSYFTKITEAAEKIGATHIIGTGDFTYGRFNNLEYRLEVEKLLERQYELTGGNRYEIKGNHDFATYGMTEYEYYISKGKFKGATNLQLGVLNISMVDFRKHGTTTIIPPEEGKINVVFAHDYFKFKDTKMPNYGDTYIELDNMEEWHGVDYLVCGHIHNHEIFEGIVVKDNRSHNLVVTYLGCMSRPAYREGHMQEVGKVLVFTVYDDNTVEMAFIDIPLWTLEESFNLETVQIKKEGISNREGLREIANKLDAHERNIGNPEDIIMSMQDMDIRYRKKAIALLKESLG